MTKPKSSSGGGSSSQKKKLTAGPAVAKLQEIKKRPAKFQTGDVLRALIDAVLELAGKT